MHTTVIILCFHINPKGTTERVTLPAGLLSVGWECFTLWYIQSSVIMNTYCGQKNFTTQFFV